MKARLLISLMVLASQIASAANPKTGRGEFFTNVSSPQPYQVITLDQMKSIYAQEQSLLDIKDKLATIAQSISEIQTDVKALKETDIIVNFLLGVAKYLVPGLLIAAFTVWFTKRLKLRPPGPGQRGDLETS
jgi:hypothetical protein